MAAAGRDLERCYGIAQTEKKGLAVFATRAIEPGTTILSDTQLMIVPRPGHLYTPNDLLSSFQALSKLEQECVLGLYSGNASTSSLSTVDQLMQIFKNNAFGNGQQTWLHAVACRINHSCVPNSTTVVDPDVPEEVHVIAEREIREGEEVTISYNNEMLEVCTAQERAVLLLRQYGFTCDCPACQPPSPDIRKASDARRRLIGECKKNLEGLGISTSARTIFDEFAQTNLLNEGEREKAILAIPQDHLCLEQYPLKPTISPQERLSTLLLLAHLRTAESLEASTIAQSWMRAAETLLYHHNRLLQQTSFPPGFVIIILPWALNIKLWMEKALRIMNRVRSPWDYEAQVLRTAWARMREVEGLEVALRVLDGDWGGGGGGEGEVLGRKMGRVEDADGERDEGVYALLVGAGGTFRLLSRREFEVAEKMKESEGTSTVEEEDWNLSRRLMRYWRDSSNVTKCGMAGACLAPVAAYWMIKGIS